MQITSYLNFIQSCLWKIVTAGEIYTWSLTQGDTTIWLIVAFIVACHLPGAPGYGGVRTWVEGSQTRGDRALAEASIESHYKKVPKRFQKHPPGDIILQHHFLDFLQLCLNLSLIYLIFLQYICIVLTFITFTQFLMAPVFNTCYTLIFIPCILCFPFVHVCTWRS